MALRQLLVAGTVLSSLASAAAMIYPGSQGLEIDPDEIELVLGEGLPSLAELNMTVHDLFDPAWRTANGLDIFDAEASESQAAPLEKRWVDICDVNRHGGSMGGGFACRDTLYAMGNQGRSCRASYGLYNTVCSMNVWNHWTYVDLNSIQRYETSSNCRDVATAVNWALQNCVNDLCKVNQDHGCIIGRTQAAAYGNGNLIVIVDGAY